MSRKGIIIVMALVMVFIFTGCNKDGGESGGKEITSYETSGLNNSQAQRSKEFLTGSINSSLHPVRVLMGVDNGGVTEKVELGIKGSERYIDFLDGEAGHTTVIISTDAVYTVNHAEKTAVKTENVSDVSGISPLDDLAFNNQDFAVTEIVKGQDQLDGKTYDYEEFVNGSTSVRLLFEGNVCKGIKSTEEGVTNTILVYEYDENVLDEKLKVPDGYTVTQV